MPEETVIRPEPIVTTEAPTPRISGGEVAQPYQMLARSLDKVGQGLEDVATPLAEQAGYKSVTRDADGNIQIERAPIFGKAGNAYAHAVKMAALAEGEGAAKRADIELREQYRDNPQGYQTAAQAYKDQTIKQYSAAAGPEVAQALGQAIDNTTTYTYRGLLNEKERLDLQRAETSINAGLESARDDAMALARQGASFEPNTPGGEALNKYTTLLDAKASNPRLAYSQEERALELQKFQSELGAQRYLYHIDQKYKAEGIEAAEQDAKSILTDPAYKLKESEREGYYHRAVGEIRANEAVRRQDIGQAQEAFRELKTAASLGQRIEPAEVDAVRKGFETANYPAGVAAVDAAFAHKDLHDDFGRQPLRDQTSQLNTIRGAAASRDAYVWLLNHGYRDVEAAGIVGNLVFESGLRPGIFGDRGTSAGLAQWHAERLDALKTYAASQGKPWHDPQTQMEFLDRELRSSESVTRGLLRTATSPEQAAQIFAQAYERPKGFDYSPRQALARSVFEGKSADGSGGPGVSSWLIANRAAAVKTSATETWSQVMKDWDSGKGPTPSRDTVGDVIDAARSTNNIDLMAKVQRDAELMDYAERIKQLPLDQQGALETELRRRITAGETRQADVPAAMDTPGADLVLKQLQERTAAIAKGLKDDPIGTVIANNPQRFKTPEPLDPSNPQQFVAGLQARAQIARAGANQYGVPPLSALDDKDVDRVKAALATPDPNAHAQVWGALATLPEDVRGPTFKKIAGNDPADTAEAAAGSMMSTAPDIAKSIFQGLAMMKGGKFDVDKAFGTKNPQGETFTDDFNKALPATVFPMGASRTDPNGDYATMGQMVRARYAYLSAQSGDMNYSADRVSKAVNDVTGGVLLMNGGQFIAPVRGMSQTQFDGVLGSLTNNDLAGVTTLNGAPITAAYLRGQARLENIGPGRYYVTLGRDQAAPIYAYRNANSEIPNKFELDLRGRQPQPFAYSAPTLALSP